MQIQDYVNIELNRHPHEFIDWHRLAKMIFTDSVLEGAFVGTYSLTTVKPSKTYVSTRHLWCGEPVSASTVARRVLMKGLELTRRKRILWNKHCLQYLDIPQPLYAEPQPEGTFLIYADIKSCYYDIYRRMPFDFFWNGFVPTWGEVWFKDFLPPKLKDFKIVRNSLVGVLRVRTSSKVHNSKVVCTGNRNVLLSPCHWGFMAELLHYFANLALECGAIYYNTDGAIFLKREDYERWKTYMEYFGFTTSIKAEGWGWVDYPGCYKVGTLGQTRRLGRIMSTSNIREKNWYAVTYWEKMLYTVNS